MKVTVYRKSYNYTAADGSTRQGVAFFLNCGGVFVPVKVVYKADKESGKDPYYLMRKSVLTAFAEELPEDETPRHTLSS